MSHSRRERIHQEIQFYCLALMAVGLPLSMFLMSVSTILLSLNWLAWGNFRQRLTTLCTNKAALIFLVIFAMHILGGLYSSDMDFYADDLRIKLPLLAYPIILGSTPALDTERIRRLMWLYIAALVLSTLVCLVIYLGLTSREVNDFRDLSPFISHIRLSLLICVGISWLASVVLTTQRPLYKLGFSVLIAWLIFSLNLLQSATGFVILGVFVAVCCFLLLWKIRNTWLRFSLLALLIVVPSVYLVDFVNDYFRKDEFDLAELDKTTLSGTLYTHSPEETVTENGHLVFIYVAYDEMEREWPKRSALSLDSTLPGDLNLQACLIRYLTSKNLRKDSAGIAALSDDDVRSIEKGETNYRYVNQSIGKRIYVILQEFDLYYHYGEMNGSSVIQRFEYLKTGWHIARSHPFFGVGTGDLRQAFNQQYETDRSQLHPKFRLRAHNQYLSIAIGFGFVGLAIFLFCLIYPAVLTRSYRLMVFNGFLITALVSFLSEDTLETQAGVSFFIFFYGLFVWARKSARSGPLAIANRQS
ncbi:MAG: O-antigen ligase family protein [Bacteroidota bacterium]